MDDKCLNKIKILWELLDVHKDSPSDLEDNEDIDIYIPRYIENLKWESPDIGILPIPLDCKNKSHVFSMNYNDERRNPISFTVILMFICLKKYLLILNIIDDSITPFF